MQLVFSGGQLNISMQRCQQMIRWAEKHQAKFSVEMNFLVSPSLSLSLPANVRWCRTQFRASEGFRCFALLVRFCVVVVFAFISFWCFAYSSFRVVLVASTYTYPKTPAIWTYIVHDYAIAMVSGGISETWIMPRSKTCSDITRRGADTHTPSLSLSPKTHAKSCEQENECTASRRPLHTMQEAQRSTKSRHFLREFHHPFSSRLCIRRTAAVCSRRWIHDVGCAALFRQ